MDEAEDRLELDSNLTELTRVWGWAEGLAERHHLADEARYAIQLCLEEGLANVILHGYGNEPGHPVVVRSLVANGWLYFAIEDEAPPFSPPEPGSASDAGKPASLESIEPGGNGIRLLRRFAGSLHYESWAGGNRLTVGFPLGQGAGMVSSRARTG